MLLRLMMAADIPAVRELHVRSFTALARDHHSAAEIAAHEALIRAPEYAAELLGANLGLAVEGDGRIVATAGWQAMPDRGEAARIRKVFVDPAAARRGLGRILVGDAEARARAGGFRDFYVRANINAVPLYRALGYREIGTGTMPAGAVALPVVFMEKRVSASSA